MVRFEARSCSWKRTTPMQLKHWIFWLTLLSRHCDCLFITVDRNRPIDRRHSDWLIGSLGWCGFIMNGQSGMGVYDCKKTGIQSEIGLYDCRYRTSNQRWVYMNVESPHHAILEHVGKIKLSDFKVTRFIDIVNNNHWVLIFWKNDANRHQHKPFKALTIETKCTGLYG